MKGCWLILSTLEKIKEQRVVLVLQLKGLKATLTNRYLASFADDHKSFSFSSLMVR